MTAEDRATAVQLVRATVADHLGHLEPEERAELVERISAAIERCARRRAAEELNVAIADLHYDLGGEGYADKITVSLGDVLRRLASRADALGRQKEGL